MANMKTCRVENCGKKHLGKGFCDSHYNQYYYQLNKKTENARCKEYYTKNKKEHNSRHVRNVIRRKKGALGYAELMYSRMSLRVRGRVRSYEKKYWEGKEIMPKKEFIEMALNDPSYMKLHKQWINGGMDRNLSPVPDRIDSTKGYTRENIQFVTCYINTIRAHQVRVDNYKKIVRDLARIPSKVTGRNYRIKKMRPEEKQAIYDLAGVKNVKKPA